ncbi:MAG: hypothetical protein HY319_32565 [Armatimonadetes bacterium]|nr:hypothetical protein [Armatimonadota bacterium]
MPRLLQSLIICVLLLGLVQVVTAQETGRGTTNGAASVNADRNMDRATDVNQGADADADEDRVTDVTRTDADVVPESIPVDLPIGREALRQDQDTLDEDGFGSPALLGPLVYAPRSCRVWA